MKKPVTLIFLLSILYSCTEEVSREINTELTQEAAQFFQFTEVLWETNYLGNISYQDFFRINSTDLPGCPTLIRSLNSRIIQLEYANPVNCEMENKTPRSGKIIVDFTLSNSTNPSWTLTFENYIFGGVQIEGSKQFKTLSANENQETFQNLRVELGGNLGFNAAGTLTHSISTSNFRPFELRTLGRIEGHNPAGRAYSVVITAPKEQIFSCLSRGWELPQSGTESWIVSRGLSGDLEYKVSFQAGAGCNPTVISTLPDGRSLQLNP